MVGGSGNERRIISWIPLYYSFEGAPIPGITPSSTISVDRT
jgi:hypothetical protein